jgi:hypothetical protein
MNLTVKNQNIRKTFLSKTLLLSTLFLFFFALLSIFGAKDGLAAEGHRLKAYYSLYGTDTGFQSYSNDSQRQSKAGNYPTALKILLKHQPEGSTGTIQYQVNISGTGWSSVYENGQVAGEGQSMPLEGLRVFLNGSLKDQYDVYYKTAVLGSWQDWVKNGEDSGKIGVGMHIDGILVTVVAKGESPKEEQPAQSTNAPKSTVDASKPMVALTFDDGPGKYEDRILAAFQKYGGKGTFFFVGNQAEKYPDVVKRVAEAGHEVANHSYKHENLPKLSQAGATQSLAKTNEILRRLSGQSVSLVRPPYGATSSSVKAALQNQGQASILWSIDTLDWKTRNAKSSINIVLQQVKDGDVILMHSIYAQSAEAAEALIPALQERGYQLVTVSELAKARGVSLQAGQNYGSFRKKG